MRISTQQDELLLELLASGPRNVAAVDWMLDWRLTQAREKQFIDHWNPHWDLTGAVAGRGFGKTLMGAKTTLIQALFEPEGRSAVVAPTSGDLRRTCFEGQSGLLNVIPHMFLWGGARDKAYNRSFSELRLDNGHQIFGYSAEEPERLRGPEHGFFWCDELGAWNKHTAGDAWDNLQMGLRLRPQTFSHPRGIFTTTPRPTPHFIDIMKNTKQGLVLVRGSTYENAANLPAKFIERIKARYEGTRLGRQEIHAELLEDIEGALWKRAWFRYISILPVFKRKVVSLDPAVTSTDQSDETGLIVAGRTVDDRGCLIRDESGRYTPGEWAKRAIRLYNEEECDAIVAEVNQGGDLVENTIRQVEGGMNVRIIKVHASKGKKLRAEPISALYEQGRMDHYRPPIDIYSNIQVHPLLEVEDQMCTWLPLEGLPSPDRLDATVHGFTELFPSQAVRQFW